MEIKAYLLEVVVSLRVSTAVKAFVVDGNIVDF